MTARILRRLSFIGVLAMLGVVVAPVPAQGASLSMTGFQPSAGPVGRQVSITGTGFTPTDIVQFNGVTAVVARVNPTATKLVTSVPPHATSGPITVTDPVTGQTVGIPGTAFAVTRGISADPAQQWAGGQFELSGSGLSPDQDESIRIGRETVGLARTDSAGNFEIGVSVPWDATSGQTKISILSAGIVVAHAIFYVLGDWPAFRHDATRSGDDPYETGLSVGQISKLKQEWKNPIISSQHATTSPAVADGVVYIGGDSSLYALSVTTGATLWTYPAANLVASPAVDDGRVLFGDLNGVVSSIDSTTGTLQWSYALGGEIESSPIAADGVVYATSDSGFIVALDEATGNVLWAHNLGTNVFSSPAVDGGLVYIGADDGNVTALKAKTGAVSWATNVGDQVLSTPSVSNGVLYVGSYTDKVNALDATTGAVIWQAATTGKVTSSPAVSGGVVYVGSLDGSLYAFDATTGAVDWSFPANNSITSSPAVANGVVYFETQPTGLGGHFNYTVLYALTAATGGLAWSKQVPALGQFIFAPSPAVADGRVYFGSGGGTVYSYGL